MPGGPRRIDLVVLVASLGGLEAVAMVLDRLPTDFPAAVLVALHTGSETNLTFRLIKARTRLAVVWAADGAAIEPGHVYVAPPKSRVFVLPIGALGVERASVTVEFGRFVDELLQSVAGAYRDRALVVVLTGMGSGGVAGVRAVKELGGSVLAQDEASSLSFGMPGAAIATGCVDLVLSIGDIGAVIDGVVTRATPLPAPLAGDALFSRGGHAGALMRRIDWSRTPLGAAAGWPAELRTLVAAVLAAPSPIFVCWSPSLVVLYNDACLPSLGVKHPRAMGQPARECWSDVWDRLGPSFEDLLRGGEPTVVRDLPFFTVRSGSVEEAYATLSLSPIRAAGGGVAGVLCTMAATTAEVLQVRRLRMLRDLAARASAAQTTAEACAISAEVLGEDPADVPFALFYLADAPAERAHLVAAAGLAPGQPASPHFVDTTSAGAAWPIAEALRTGEPVLVDDIVERFRALPCEPWGDTPQAALVTPILLASDDRLVGAVVLGVSPRHDLDATYRDLLDLVSAQIALSVANARTRQLLSDRADRLVALDLTKTNFLSQVSQELQTPLALLLGPLDDLLAGSGALAPGQRASVELAQRGALRLADFVTALLDFSKLQGQRKRASFELLDLAAYTRELCAVLREAADRAGVRLVVDCADLPAPVPVDRELWEKIVLNLLVEALRSTPAGEIEVKLRKIDHHVELCVRDTGAGIPDDELAHVLDPFRPAHDAGKRGGTFARLSLALVRELVQLHRGFVHVTSAAGQGTTFTVWIPASLPPHLEARPAEGNALPSDAVVRGALRRVANRVPGDPAAAGAAPDAARSEHRVLVAEGDADLRAYLARVLSPHWSVEACAGGEAALAAARARPPHLVVAEVMLPGLDGFGLLRQIRADRDLGRVPVVLITARAGDEPTAEALDRGADDVIVKPFSTRELCARVRRLLARTPAPRAGPRRRRAQ